MIMPMQYFHSLDAKLLNNQQENVVDSALAGGNNQLAER